MTSLCGDAHAPSWLPRGREAKYASLSASLTRSTSARTRTWRCRSSQENTAAATGAWSSWSTLGAGVVGVEDEAALIGLPNEHDPGVRDPVGTDRGHRHGVRFGDTTVESILVPAVPLHDRVTVDIGDLEPLRLVLLAPTPQFGATIGRRPVGHGRTARSIRSIPRMYGRSTSGTVTDPSGLRYVSMIAAHTRGTASAEPFNVCTNSVPLRSLPSAS